MSEKEGTLRMMPSGQWAVCRPGETPHEITSGDLFHIKLAAQESRATAGRPEAQRGQAPPRRWSVGIPKATSCKSNGRDGCIRSRGEQQ
jgi:hypothetical protein